MAKKNILVERVCMSDLANLNDDLYVKKPASWAKNWFESLEVFAFMGLSQECNLSLTFALAVRIAKQQMPDRFSLLSEFNYKKSSRNSIFADQNSIDFIFKWATEQDKTMFLLKYT